jgi:hypothetical protein
MHENRETSEVPEADLRDRPAGEGNSRTARMHVFEESDSGGVPMNHSNKSGQPPAESEEGRPLIKENTHQSSTHSTQGEARVSQGLAGVRKAARERKEMKFTALLHHLTVTLLRESFYALKRKAAPGGMASHGRSMRPGWKAGSPTCTAESTVALIGRSRREEFSYRNRMVGNGHSGSRPWRTRLFNRLWSRSSTRFMKRTFGVSRTASGQSVASIKRWMRCTSRSRGRR